MRLRIFKAALDGIAALQSFGPTQSAAISHDQDQQPEADPVPRERREIVRGNVAQQPSNTDECADKRCQQPDDKQTQRIDGQRAPLLCKLVKRGAENNRNREEEGKLGSDLTFQPE